MSQQRAIDVYLALLASIGERAGGIGTRPIVSHWPHRGSDGSRVMIVGQAVYGWPDDWRAAEANTAVGRADILEFTLARNADETEPMGWVEHSDRRDKPFWRSCRLLTEALAPISTAPWWGRFTWVNLYPVAWEANPNAPPGSPTAHPDNPGGELKKAQDPFVADLLRETVAWLDPEIVVVFGGPYWWPASHAVSGLTERPRPLMRAGQAEGRIWVVGWHPNGANRRGFTPQRYVPLIVDAMNGSASPPEPRASPER